MSNIPTTDQEANLKRADYAKIGASLTAENFITASEEYWSRSESENTDLDSKKACFQGGVSSGYGLLKEALQGSDGGLTCLTLQQKDFLHSVMLDAVGPGDKATGSRFKLDHAKIMQMAMFLLELRKGQRVMEQSSPVASIAGEERADMKRTLS